jgi:hypothetical protein
VADPGETGGTRSADPNGDFHEAYEIGQVRLELLIGGLG